MKATLKNFHEQPRKVRLVADLIRGKSVPVARDTLAFLPKKAAPAIGKLLDSAVANSKLKPEDLFVKTIAVNKGMAMKRYRPFGRGRSGTISKTMSIVTLELGRATVVAKKPRAKKATAKNSPSKLKAES